MEKQMNRKLVLENGTEYLGCGFGADVQRVCELVFDTAMAGYQEIVSDPNNAGKMVVMTYPVIGNYGMTDEDYEAKTPSIGGLVAREYNDCPSNFRYTRTLSEVMEENGIPGIYGMDTRMITRTIRDCGAMKALLCSADLPHEEAMEILRTTELPRDLVQEVSCQRKWHARIANAKYSVVAVDCGIELSILDALKRRGCNVTVVPYTTSLEEIEQMKPDGVLLSNGPGDPEAVPEVIALAKDLRGRFPMLGIGLGHQVIGLAYGAKTRKMKLGHWGGNHPVRNLETGRLEIAAQNHSYEVVPESVEGTGLEVTHVNVLDGSVEAMRSAEDKVIAVQYHPESAPDHQDSAYFYDDFVALMKEEKANA